MVLSGGKHRRNFLGLIDSHITPANEWVVLSTLIAGTGFKAFHVIHYLHLNLPTVEKKDYYLKFGSLPLKTIK